jgi:hypothetical protein
MEDFVAEAIGDDPSVPIRSLRFHEILLRRLLNQKHISALQDELIRLFKCVRGR